MILTPNQLIAEKDLRKTWPWLAPEKPHKASGQAKSRTPIGSYGSVRSPAMRGQS